MEAGPIAPQYIEPCAFEHAGTDVPQNISPEDQITGAVLKHIVDRLDTILLAVRAEATTGQFHHAGAVRPEPEVAAEILVDGRDVEITQPVACRV